LYLFFVLPASPYCSTCISSLLVLSFYFISKLSFHLISKLSFCLISDSVVWIPNKICKDPELFVGSASGSGMGF
jgi:hypothetical protein